MGVGPSAFASNVSSRGAARWGGWRGWDGGRVLALKESVEGVPAACECPDVFLALPLWGPLDSVELEGDGVGGGRRMARWACPYRGVQDGLGGRGVGEAVGVPPLGASFALEEGGARSGPPLPPCSHYRGRVCRLRLVPGRGPAGGLLGRWCGILLFSVFGPPCRGRFPAPSGRGSVGSSRSCAPVFWSWVGPRGVRG